MKIRILCEGPSDSDAIRAFLHGSSLTFSGLGIEFHNMRGISRAFERIRAYVDKAIEIDGVDSLFVLVDLVGSQQHVPGTISPEAVKQALQGRVQPQHQRRFHPHVAVHEIEAWIFADHRTLGKRLGASVRPFGEPEKIDFTSNPSHELNELYRRHRGHPYKKTTELPLLFGELSAELIYSKCPNFALFLDELLKVSGLPHPFKN